MTNDSIRSFVDVTEPECLPSVLRGGMPKPVELHLVGCNSRTRVNTKDKGSHPRAIVAFPLSRINIEVTIDSHRNNTGFILVLVRQEERRPSMLHTLLTGVIGFALASVADSRLAPSTGELPAADCRFAVRVCVRVSS